MEADVILGAVVLAVTSPVAEAEMASVGAVRVVAPVAVIDPVLTLIGVAVSDVEPAPVSPPFILIVFAASERLKVFVDAAEDVPSATLEAESVMYTL